MTLNPTKLLALLLGIWTSKQQVASFEVPTVDYDDLTSSSIVRSALGENGLLAVTGIPNLDVIRKDVFTRAMDCSFSMENGQEKSDDEHPLKMTLKDGTDRTTWAASAQISRRTLMQGANKCAGLEEKMEDLRKIIDSFSERFAKGLDQWILKPEVNVGLMHGKDRTYSTFSDLLHDGPHLDHFHVYEKKDHQEQTSASETLPFHTDQGLMIALVPALKRVNGEFVADHDFEVELADGQVTSLNMPNHGNVVLIMIGDGSAFLNTQAHSPLRPVPHRLRISSGSLRAWYGRMYFPVAEASIHAEDTTFEEVRQSFMNSYKSGSKEYTGPGCSGKGRKLHQAANECGENEIYCWLECVSVADLGCSKSEAKCIDSKNGNEWNPLPDNHCLTCSAQCPSSNPTSPPSSSPSCPKCSKLKKGACAREASCCSWNKKKKKCKPIVV